MLCVPFLFRDGNLVGRIVLIGYFFLSTGTTRCVLRCVSARLSKRRETRKDAWLAGIWQIYIYWQKRR